MKNGFLDKMRLDYTDKNYHELMSPFLKNKHLVLTDSNQLPINKSITLYVDSIRGDDSGDGTIDNPYQNLQFVIDSIKDADPEKIYNIKCRGPFLSQITFKPYINITGDYKL